MLVQYFGQDTCEIVKMIGKILFLATVAVTSAVSHAEVGHDRFTCDPQGQVYLLLPHHTDCSKFYMCVHGKEIEFSCPADLIFDFSLQVCNWPSATKCELRPEEDEEEEGSGDIIGWEEYDITKDLRSGVHQFSDQAVLELDCAGVHASTKLAAYRGDCQRYWRCTNGIPEAAFCTDGLYFNPRSLQCDFEANVICARDAHEELGEEFIRM